MSASGSWQVLIDRELIARELRRWFRFRQPRARLAAVSALCVAAASSAGAFLPYTFAPNNGPLVATVPSLFILVAAVAGTGSWVSEAQTRSLLEELRQSRTPAGSYLVAGLIPLVAMLMAAAAPPFLACIFLALLPPLPFELAWLLPAWFPMLTFCCILSVVTNVIATLGLLAVLRSEQRAYICSLVLIPVQPTLVCGALAAGVGFASPESLSLAVLLFQGMLFGLMLLLLPRIISRIVGEEHLDPSSTPGGSA